MLLNAHMDDGQVHKGFVMCLASIWGCFAEGTIKDSLILSPLGSARERITIPINEINYLVCPWHTPSTSADRVTQLRYKDDLDKSQLGFLVSDEGVKFHPAMGNVKELLISIPLVRNQEEEIEWLSCYGALPTKMSFEEKIFKVQEDGPTSGDRYNSWENTQHLLYPEADYTGVDITELTRKYVPAVLGSDPVQLMHRSSTDYNRVSCIERILTDMRGF